VKCRSAHSVETWRVWLRIRQPLPCTHARQILNSSLCSDLPDWRGRGDRRIAVLSGPVGWVVIGIGAVTAGTGLGFMGSGVTHAVDAVNIHNDGAPDKSPGAGALFRRPARRALAVPFELKEAVLHFD